MSSARNALNEISRTYSQVHAHKANISLRHYSYECKAAAQERPYISRPSRTQQLFNPKLAPKLTEAKPPALESKQGVADQELAKLEAERAKKRELERDDDEGSERGEISKRRRSASYDSVSTISTGRSRSRSPSPARDLSRSPSPVRRAAPSRSATPDQRRPQRRGYSRDSRSVERTGVASQREEGHHGRLHARTDLGHQQERKGSGRDLHNHQCRVLQIRIDVEMGLELRIICLIGKELVDQGIQHLALNSVKEASARSPRGWH
ncbi:hypothetical protein PG995_009390 [Apiospora arundinis]